MATTSSTAGTGANETGVGSFAWTSPTSAQGAADASNSSAAADGVDPGLSNRLKLTNFSGLSIPSGSTINGITAVVKKKRLTGENCKDSRVYLLKAGSEVGSNKADTVTNWATTLTDKTYGSASDLWGTTWADTDFGSTFGIGIVSNLQTADAISYVDCVTITVDYTAPVGGGQAVRSVSNFRRRRTD